MIGLAIFICLSLQAQLQYFNSMTLGIGTIDYTVNTDADSVIFDQIGGYGEILVDLMSTWLKEKTLDK